MHLDLCLRACVRAWYEEGGAGMVWYGIERGRQTDGP